LPADFVDNAGNSSKLKKELLGRRFASVVLFFLQLKNIINIKGYNRQLLSPFFGPYLYRNIAIYKHRILRFCNNLINKSISIFPATVNRYSGRKKSFKVVIFSAGN